MKGEEFFKFDGWRSEDVRLAAEKCGIVYDDLDKDMKRLLDLVWFQSHTRALHNAVKARMGEDI